MRTRSGRLIGLLCVVTAVRLFGLSLSVIRWPKVSGAVIAWWRLLVSAALWWAVPWRCVTPAGPTSAFVLFGEHPHWRALAWGLLSVAGLIIVLTNGPARDVATVGGDVLPALGALAFCAYQLGARRARRSTR